MSLTGTMESPVSPTNLAVASFNPNEIGDTNGDFVYRVWLGWTPSITTNVTGYIVYEGSASNTFTQTYDVGNVTNAAILLDFSEEYFFVVTAYNQLGLESNFSSEVKYGRWPNDRVTINWPTNPPASLLLSGSLFLPRQFWTVAVPAPNSGSFTAMLSPGVLFACLLGSTNKLNIFAWNPQNTP